MNGDASPRPWRAIYARILDARGKTVCVCEKDSMHGRPDDDMAKADAMLICDAVNHIEETKKLSIKLYNPIRRAEAERDRLRDVVRRLANNIERYHLVGVRDRALLREARAALGEGEPPTGEGVR